LLIGLSMVAGCERNKNTILHLFLKNCGN